MANARSLIRWHTNLRRVTGFRTHRPLSTIIPSARALQNTSWNGTGTYEFLHSQRLRVLSTSSPFCQSAVVSPEKVLKCPFQDSMDTIPGGSIALHVMKTLEGKGTKVAMEDGVTDEKLTSEELRMRAMKVASGLRRRGFGAGDVLCIIAFNTLHYPATFLATSLNGGVLTLANPAYNEDELEHILTNSGASWIVVGGGLEGLAQSAAKRVGNIREIFSLESGVEGCTSFQELLEDTGELFQPYTEVNPEKDIVILPYSSGTTGLPKGVMVTHANLAAAFMQFRDARTLGTNDDDVLMLFLPFFHSLGFIMMFASLINAYAAVLIPRFSPEVFLRVIQDYKVTFFAAVPPVVLFLSQAPIVDKYDISSLKRMFCAAAPLSAEVQDALQKRTGGHLEVRQGYGMTESVAAISLCSQENRVGSVGQVSGYMNVKVVDLESRQPLGLKQEGEICLKGPQVTPGYYKNEAATAETFDEEGWLRTGDVGYYDEEGFLYIVDRIKELIKYKGLQVAPAELEGLLLQHPDLVDVAVVGREDPRAGELPTAFVVAKLGTQTTAEEIQSFIAARVSDHKQLRGGVIFLDAIPKTATGKILRKEIKKLAAKL